MNIVRGFPRLLFAGFVFGFMFFMYTQVLHAEERNLQPIFAPLLQTGGKKVVIPRPLPFPTPPRTVFAVRPGYGEGSDVIPADAPCTPDIQTLQAAVLTSRPVPSSLADLYSRLVVVEDRDFTVITPFTTPVSFFPAFCAPGIVQNSEVRPLQNVDLPAESALRLEQAIAVSPSGEIIQLPWVDREGVPMASLPPVAFLEPGHWIMQVEGIDGNSAPVGYAIQLQILPVQSPSYFQDESSTVYLTGFHPNEQIAGILARLVLPEGVENPALLSRGLIESAVPANSTFVIESRIDTSVDAAGNAVLDFSLSEDAFAAAPYLAFYGSQGSQIGLEVSTFTEARLQTLGVIRAAGGLPIDAYLQSRFWGEQRYVAGTSQLVACPAYDLTRLLADYQVRANVTYEWEGDLELFAEPASFEDPSVLAGVNRYRIVAGPYCSETVWFFVETLELPPRLGWIDSGISEQQLREWWN